MFQTARSMCPACTVAGTTRCGRRDIADEREIRVKEALGTVDRDQGSPAARMQTAHSCLLRGDSHGPTCKCRTHRRADRGDRRRLLHHEAGEAREATEELTTVWNKGCRPRPAALNRMSAFGESGRKKVLRTRSPAAAGLFVELIRGDDQLTANFSSLIAS
jgi:hypothetical protein